MNKSWVILMIARVYMDDPELVELDFSHQYIPVQEALAFPRLIEGLSRKNTHLKVLKMNNSLNLDSAACAKGFAEIFKHNSTLQRLELDSNHLDMDCLQSMFSALGDRDSKTKLQTLKISNLLNIGYNSYSAEQIMMEGVKKNDSLIELGFHLRDAHARDTINRKLLRNRDLLRIQRNKEIKELKEAATLSEMDFDCYVKEPAVDSEEFRLSTTQEEEEEE